MRATLVGLLMLGLLVLASIVLALAYYGSMPDRVASKFDFAGVAVGSQSKVALLFTHLGVALGIAFGFVPLVYVLLRLCPARMFDMPHKDYWFAEPRQRQTRRTVFRYVLWLMDINLALFTALFWLVYRANLAKPPEGKVSGTFFGRRLRSWTDVLPKKVPDTFPGPK